MRWLYYSQRWLITRPLNGWWPHRHNVQHVKWVRRQKQEIFDCRRELALIYWTRAVMEVQSFRDKDVLALHAKLEQHQLRRDEEIEQQLKTGIQRRIADRPTKGFSAKWRSPGVGTRSAWCVCRRRCVTALRLPSTRSQIWVRWRRHFESTGQSPDRDFAKPPRDSRPGIFTGLHSTDVYIRASGPLGQVNIDSSTS